MTTRKKIRVMISSRCRDEIEFEGRAQSLTAVRRELKRQILLDRYLDSELVEVWINEDEPPEEGSTDSWDACLQEIDNADIVIVLFNGNSGWTVSGGGVGICHAELERALSQAPAKVRLIEIEPLTATPIDKDLRFRDYVRTQSLFRGGTVRTGEELIGRAKEALAAAIVHQVQLGVREAKKGKYHLGASLDWARLDYSQRKNTIEAAIAGVLGGESGDRILVHKVSGENLVMSIHGIPDGYGTAEARELVGRPFLNDYKLVDEAPLSERAKYGPVHTIGIHKNMTESQARKFFGHPNILLVNAPFGFYLADRIEHVQSLIVVECRDETSTRHGVQRCLEWLNQSGEGVNVALRAKKRRAILKEIAKHAS